MKSRRQWVLVLFMLTVTASLAFAADGSSLKPPSGSQVALVVFEDMECPYCAHAYPLVWQAATAAHIPVVLHDFPLTIHPWAFEAAVYARFFDTKNTKTRNTGNDFRKFIYENQPQITPDNLRQYAQKFADANHIILPDAIDPQGKLKAEVKADLDLGNTCHLSQTPTIFIVAGGHASPTFVEVVNLDNMSAMIQEMQKRAGPAPSPTPARRATAKVH